MSVTAASDLRQAEAREGHTRIPVRARIIEITVIVEVVDNVGTSSRAHRQRSMKSSEGNSSLRGAIGVSKTIGGHFGLGASPITTNLHPAGTITRGSAHRYDRILSRAAREARGRRTHCQRIVLCRSDGAWSRRARNEAIAPSIVLDRRGATTSRSIAITAQSLQVSPRRVDAAMQPSGRAPGSCTRTEP